jgi:VWFA-related protein
MRIWLTVAVFLMLAGLSTPAQQAPPAAPQQPPVTFKVEVNYVEIDAVVTDAAGTFVRELTKEDFEVTEEGKPQAISTFTLVNVPVERPDPPLFKRTTVEPDVQSNRGGANGRVFLLVLDDLQTDARRTPRVRAAARQFVERHVGANDLVAVVQTGGSTSGSQEFTSSHPRLLAAVDKFVGKKLPSITMAKLDSYYTNPSRRGTDAYDAERSAKARDTLDTLRNLAEYLGGIRGRRKAIVWFGEGIDYPMDNPFDSRDASVVRDLMLDTIAAATRASVSFYGIDPRGLGAGMDETIDIASLPDDPTVNLGPGSIQEEVRQAQNSLRTISTETGGFAVVNKTDMTEAFSRIVRENSSYYLIGYYSSDERRDGKFRSVGVRVKRPGLEVRARKGYTAPKGRPAARSATLGSDASPEVREALNSPLPTTGLTMAVFAAPFVGKAPKASIAVIVEIEPGQLKFVEKNGVFAEDLELVAIAVDSNGKVQDGGRDQAPLRLTQRNYESVMRSGLRLTRRLQLRPGRYQLRVAARESNGAAVGGVSLDLDVPDFAKAPLAMSGIALTSPSASRTVTANPDPEFKDVLPASPTALREFPPGDVLSLFVEVYDNQRAAHRVAIRTSVRADDGREVFASSDERGSDELQGSKGGGYGHVGTIPLKDLPRGRYVLRVEAKTLRSDGAAAAREVEFRIR